jgi:hypothetical protein
MDRPPNPMVIVGVIVVKGPVKLDQLEERLAKRLLAFPLQAASMQNGAATRKPLQ